MVDFTPEISEVLKSHNDKRNQIAGGQLNGFLPAVQMAEMQWDNELAQLAVLNVKQCVMEHDSCRNTAQFAWAGQNLFSKRFIGTSLENSILISEAINAWWSENKDSNMDQINSFPENYNGP